jgi:hypothetical protein
MVGSHRFQVSVEKSRAADPDGHQSCVASSQEILGRIIPHIYNFAR